MSYSSLNSVIATSPPVAGNSGGSKGGGTAGENSTADPSADHSADHSLAIELLTRCALAGIDVALNDRGGLRISGPPAKVELAKPEVAAAKPAILAYLAERQAPIPWPVVRIADDPDYQSPEGQQRLRGVFGMTLAQWKDVAWFCEAVGDGGDLEPVWGWWVRGNMADVAGGDSMGDSGKWLDVKATGNRIAQHLSRWRELNQDDRQATLETLERFRRVVASYSAAAAARPSDVELFSPGQPGRPERTFTPDEMKSALRDLTIRQRHTLRGRRPRGENGSSKRKRSD